LHAMTSSAPPAVVMRTGEPLLVEQLPARVPPTVGDGDGSAPALAADVQSLMVTPLPGPDGLLGVIAFGLNGQSRHYEADDLVLAREIARRVAPAIDDA